MMTAVNHDPRIDTISDSIRTIPDFPHAGIMFYDVTTILLNPIAFKDSIDLLTERYRHQNIDIVAGKIPAMISPNIALYDMQSTF